MSASQVTDKRDTVFQDKRTELLFPGAGISLGGQQVKDQETNTEKPKITREIPNAGQFIHSVPTQVILYTLYQRADYLVTYCIVFIKVLH